MVRVCPQARPFAESDINIYYTYMHTHIYAHINACMCKYACTLEHVHTQIPIQAGL